MKNIDRKKALKECYILILGMFGFSMLGQYVVLNVLRLPVSLMEIYYLPLLYLYRRQIYSWLLGVLRKPDRSMLFIGGGVIVGILAGVIGGNSWIFILEYRSIIYLLLVFFWMKNNEVHVPIDLVLKLTIYTMLGELIYILGISTSEVVSSVNCLAISLAIISAFFCERYVIGIAAFVMGAMLGVVSGFRIGIVIAAVALLESIVFTAFRQDCKNNAKVYKKRMIVVGVCIVGIVIGLLNYEFIIMLIAKITGMSQFAVFRVTERMKALLSFDFVKSQDGVRFEIFQYPLERFFNCIIPRGLIGSLIGEYWLYIDVSLIYLYDIFGSVGTILIIGYLCFVVCRQLKMFCYHTKDNYVQSAKSFKLVCIMMFPILLMLLIINGTFMVIVFQALETAVVLGSICRKSSNGIGVKE